MLGSIEAFRKSFENKPQTLVEVIDDLLDRAGDPLFSEAVFTTLYSDRAGIQARMLASLAERGLQCGALGGVPITVKDLFDVAGEVTLAGSKVLSDGRKAAKDAIAVERVRQAGAIVIGKTNMTEFAYSALGINPHYGTPVNPWRKDEHRIPGGSSSGAAVSVANGTALAALGTDTGGSVRIPAAMCGVVGFKPTAATVSRVGTVPLSITFDSVGPLARTVDCCARVYEALSGVATAPAIHPGHLSLLLPTNYVQEGMDATVDDVFGRAVQKLVANGVRVLPTPLPLLDSIPDLFRGGGITAIEAYAWHKDFVASRAAEYDPLVLSRILLGRDRTGAEYIELLNQRRALVEAAHQALRGWSAVIMPTVPIIPPRLSDLASPERYHEINRLLLRNPTIANLLDLCSISLPCHQAGEAPVGLMLMGETSRDSDLLSVARSVEQIVSTT
jgi:aspartyl-tRNA(Asn)/glutamyl-tRNA(Gln) amidotransferase subunit A